MKNLFKMLMCGVTLSLSFSAYADGTNSGGGGTSMVCRNAKGEITSAKLLDLYEGERNNKFKYDESQKLTTDQYFKKALKRIEEIDFGASVEVAQGYMVVTRGKKESKLNEGLSLPNDLGRKRAVRIPKGCAIETTAYYEIHKYYNSLVIVPEIFNKLSPLHQAALYMHEAVYFQARRILNQKDSEDSRELVSLLFAKNSQTRDIENLLDLVSFRSVPNHESVILDSPILDQFGSEKEPTGEAKLWISSQPVIEYPQASWTLGSIYTTNPDWITWNQRYWELHHNDGGGAEAPGYMESFSGPKVIDQTDLNGSCHRDWLRSGKMMRIVTKGGRGASYQIKTLRGEVIYSAKMGQTSNVDFKEHGGFSYEKTLHFYFRNPKINKLSEPIYSDNCKH